MRICKSNLEGSFRSQLHQHFGQGVELFFVHQKYHFGFYMEYLNLETSVRWPWGKGYL